MKLVFVVISIYCCSVLGQKCDLTPVQQCVGVASDLVPRIYFNPVSGDLLGDILENYCDKRIDHCLQVDYGNCTKNALAPYETVINTLRIVCRSDIVKSSCFTRADVQYTCGFCFQLFKVVVDNVVSDPSLTSTEVSTGLCNAYADVRSCCMDAAFATCNTRDQGYIATLLSTTTRANRMALGC